MGKKQSKLNPDVLEELKRKTCFTEEELTQWYDLFITEFPGGKISLKKFQKYYRKFFPYGDPMDFATIVFQSYDKNRDGKIEFKELIEALAVTSKGQLEDKLKCAFHLYDLNGDGFISKTEMMTIVSAIYKMLGKLVINVTPEEDSPEKRVEKLFTLMDKNHDNLISLEEFERGAKSDHTILEALVCPQTFFTDANHNNNR